MLSQNWVDRIHEDGGVLNNRDQVTACDYQNHCDSQEGQSAIKEADVHGVGEVEFDSQREKKDNT